MRLHPLDLAAVGVAAALATAVLVLRDSVEYLLNSPDPAHRVALAVFLLSAVTTAVGTALTVRTRPKPRPKPREEVGELVLPYNGVYSNPLNTEEQPSNPPPSSPSQYSYDNLTLEKALATAVLRAVEKLTAEAELTLDSGEQEFDILGRKLKGRLTVKLKPGEEVPREDVESPL